MADQEDWFNVDDEDFREKLRENREVTTLFTERALVVFWKFLNWCKQKGSFLLAPFMFLLVTLFGIEMRDIRKLIPVFKQSLNGFFSDLQLTNELNWDTISDLDKIAVINKDVRLIEGFEVPKLSGHLRLWKSSNLAMEAQAQHRNLSSSSSMSSSSSSSSSVLPSLASLNAAANNLITTPSGEINWPSVAWLSSMAPTASYSNPSGMILQQLGIQNQALKELLEANKKNAGSRKKKKKQHKHKLNNRKRKKKSGSDKDSESSESSESISLLESSDHDRDSSSSSDDD